MGQIRTGKPHTRPDAPAHVTGIREGNERRGHERQIGHHDDGTADARRSTGIRPRKHNAILKIMPNLPPG
ncbi:hypothetical protein [Actinoallomurus iriomotensis]|uniref:Uncharacterized protein n=1 Tax=Actinoallomurus iriomotensis TaxID=478107 RepID=A0A9W6RWV9_9ACTN|nr:hypothetical protein [Actinoallomurus iriomotensis]GLY83251.1 hypothetical protein Airi02_011810 [Actinoallomurus iriomotensis]